MVFESIEEAIDSRVKNITVDTDIDFRNHRDEYEYFSGKHRLNFGNFFLYEKVEGKGSQNLIFYPKLGLFLNSLPCDQTLELEWVDYRRTCEWNIKVKSVYMSEYASEINRIVLWSDSIFIYDRWDKMPSWKELISSYRKTWWFKRTISENRNIIINQILN